MQFVAQFLFRGAPDVLILWRALQSENPGCGAGSSRFHREMSNSVRNYLGHACEKDFPTVWRGPAGGSSQLVLSPKG